MFNWVYNWGINNKRKDIKSNENQKCSQDYTCGAGSLRTAGTV